MGSSKNPSQVKVCLEKRHKKLQVQRTLFLWLFCDAKRTGMRSFRHAPSQREMSHEQKAQEASDMTISVPFVVLQCYVDRHEELKTRLTPNECVPGRNSTRSFRHGAP